MSEQRATEIGRKKSRMLRLNVHYQMLWMTISATRAATVAWSDHDRQRADPNGKLGLHQKCQCALEWLPRLTLLRLTFRLAGPVGISAKYTAYHMPRSIPQKLPCHKCTFRCDWELKFFGSGYLTVGMPVTSSDNAPCLNLLALA